MFCSAGSHAPKRIIPIFKKPSVTKFKPMSDVRCPLSIVHFFKVTTITYVLFCHIYMNIRMKILKENTQRPLSLWLYNWLLLPKGIRLGNYSTSCCHYHNDYSSSLYYTRIILVFHFNMLDFLGLDSCLTLNQSTSMKKLSRRLSWTVG